MRRPISLLLAVLVLGAYSPGTDNLASGEEIAINDIQGYWLLQSYERDGRSHDAEPGVNTARHAWMEVTDHIGGDAGCNDFGTGRATIEDGTLVLAGDVVFTAMLCAGSGELDDPLMQVETALREVLWGDGPIAVSLQDNEMTWSSGSISMKFARANGPPPTTTVPRPVRHSVGRLACGDGVVVEKRLSDTGQEPLDIAREAAPATVDVVAGGPLEWWGTDADGTVIVALALGDVENADYQVWVCDPPLGSHTSADLPLPGVCYELYEAGTPELPPDTEIVAQLPFRSGLLVVYAGQQSGAAVFSVLECIPGGGTTGGGGGPGETWQGCYRVEWSDLGYAIAFLESPNWVITIAGNEPDVVATSDGRGVAVIERTFDRTPELVIVNDGGEPCD